MCSDFWWGWCSVHLYAIPRWTCVFFSSALFIRVFFRSLSIYWKSTYSLHRLTPSSCNDHRNQLAMYSAQSTEHTCMSDWNEMKRVLCQRKSTQWKNCRLILLMFNKIVMQFSSLFFSLISSSLVRLLLLAIGSELHLFTGCRMRK